MCICLYVYQSLYREASHLPRREPFSVSIYLKIFLLHDNIKFSCFWVFSLKREKRSPFPFKNCQIIIQQ